jgi:Ser/Thr protein kinase RdoA (MazF antagonist)
MRPWKKSVTDSQIETQYLPIALEALKAFPIELEDIQAICRSENVTFRVIPRDSQTHYALRLHRPGYNSLAEMNSERQWVRALKDSGLAVPESLATTNGDHFYPVHIEATGEQCLSGMTTWLEGDPLNEYLEECTELKARQRIYRQIGVMTAKSHNQSTGWQAPPGFQRRKLDAEGLVGETPHWGQFWEHAMLSRSERNLLQRARQKIHAALGHLGMESSTFSLIHADLNSDNIIYNNGKLAMIDFDDSAYGWHMYDIATTLFEQRNHPDFASLHAALIDGYKEHRQLDESTLNTLDLFLLIRGLALIGWFHQRPEHDEPQYIRALLDDMCAKCEALC